MEVHLHLRDGGRERAQLPGQPVKRQFVSTHRSPQYAIMRVVVV